MDPNFAGLVIPLGRIFATWVAKNHKTVWWAILGTFSYVKELEDGTLGDGEYKDDYDPPEYYDNDELEACWAYFDFDHASVEEKNSGVNGDYGDEYHLSDEDMDYLDWFCQNAP